VRVLHVGSGFRPWRRGGLVAYVEDLMDEQVRRGDEVGYFFAGRMYPRGRGPRLRRWSRADVPFYEVVNSPLHDHGRQPLLELDEPGIERIFAEVLDEFRPDVVHHQEIAGLPSSLLEVADRLGVPSVVTLQDYYWVCPTFKLMCADGTSCAGHATGAECRPCSAAEPRGPGVLFDATVTYDLERMTYVKRIDPEIRDPRIHRLARFVGRHSGPTRGPQGDAGAFRRRREGNVRRLSKADRVIAMSRRVAELHAGFGVAEDRLQTLNLTLEHIAKLTPRVASGEGPVTFATLAAFESVAKGGRLLLDTVRLLARTRVAGGFRVVVFGRIDPAFAAEAAGLEAIEIRGQYTPSQLDGMLDDVDVGLMPSVWEEAYGFAGAEFLAKGIPVVANAIGGMTDYAHEGETGWLNRSLGADELARIMAGIVERPGQVAELNARLRADRDRIVKSMPRHAQEMDDVYAEVVAARQTPAAMKVLSR
jgi:glycosyltransferase involved in cell wall biosynthesis